MMEMQKNQVKKVIFLVLFPFIRKISLVNTQTQTFCLFFSLFLRYDNNAVSWYSLMNLWI